MINIFACGRNKLIILALFILAACREETPPELVLLGGNNSIGEKAAEEAGVFLRERTVAAREININPDGSASVSGVDGPELARFYWFGPEDWIAVLPQGFYTALGGSVSSASSRIGVKTKNDQFVLSQFAGFFLRPDIVEDALVRGGDTEMPFTLDSVLREGKRPPEFSLSDINGNNISLKVKSGGEGGLLALWGAAEEGGSGELLGLVNLEKSAAKKYREKDFYFYETDAALRNFAFPFMGFSVFNSEKTMESERLWIKNEEYAPAARLPVSGEGARPVLRVLFAGSFSGELADLFSAQEQGGLYSGVEIYRTNGRDGAGFAEAFEELAAEAEEEDVIVCLLDLPVSSGPLGDYSFFPGGGTSLAADSSALKGLSSWDLAEDFFGLKARRSFLIIDAGNMVPLDEETAFARLGQLLGLKTLMANFSFGETAGEQATGGGTATLALPAAESNGQYLRAWEFVSFIQERFSPSSKKLKTINDNDFPFLDTHSGYGEIKMQTMFSGMAWISGIDEAPSVLTFGETLRRKVPAGSYSVTMIYRNGHRETKTTDVGYNASNWVIFNYTPELLEGDFSRLPAFGVNIAELNPGNYKNSNSAVLKAMEVPEWRIAFLAGEELYREGSYERAITEYSKSISLKGDYASSYVSRGNAYRKKGEAGRAIEDYTRALRIKPDYAELYNYRGYLYSQSGDYARAASDYTQAVKYRVDYADALFNRAYVYAKQEKWDAAIEDYTRVLGLEPRNASAYRERGRAWRNKGDEEMAEADFERAEGINRN